MTTKITKWTRDKKCTTNFTDDTRKGHQTPPYSLRSPDIEVLKKLCQPHSPLEVRRHSVSGARFSTLSYLLLDQNFEEAKVIPPESIDPCQEREQTPVMKESPYITKLDEENRKTIIMTLQQKIEETAKKRFPPITVEEITQQRKKQMAEKLNSKHNHKSVERSFENKISEDYEKYLKDVKQRQFEENQKKVKLRESLAKICEEKRRLMEMEKKDKREEKLRLKKNLKKLTIEETEAMEKKKQDQRKIKKLYDDHISQANNLTRQLEKLEVQEDMRNAEFTAAKQEYSRQMRGKLDARMRAEKFDPTVHLGPDVDSKYVLIR